LDYPEYYRHLPVRENVKRIFLNNCILHKNIEDQQLELIKTIVLYEKNKFIDKELLMMDREVICTQQDFDFIVRKMNIILSIIVPDCDLMDQWQKTLAMASISMAGRIPILFIIDDLVDTFKGIYKQALNKFQLLFYYQTFENKATYISEQINDLIYLESNIPEKGYNLNSIITDLMIHLRSVLENMLFQKNNILTKMEGLLDETQMQELKANNSKILAFNYKGIKDDKITAVNNTLIKYKAIPPETTSPQLRAKFNGHEQGKPIEWLGTQGDLMTFIKEMVRVNEPDFTSYKQPWKIAEKCFMKKGGIEMFDAKKLRLSKPTINERKFIEAARKFK